MQDTACVLTEDHPLRERVSSKYIGSRGHWKRYWSKEDASLFPFFLGSQGIYSTLEDYGRFMEFWMSNGRSRTERLLGARYVRKALVSNPFGFPGSSGFAEVTADYGFLMQLWLGAGEEGSEEPGDLVALGHSGSDGTWAWAFPEQKAIVLYFTQSRGNTTGLRVEAALGELLLGDTFDPKQAAPPLEQYLGYYAEDIHSRYQTIMMDDGELALETPGKRIRQLVYAGGDRWKFRVKPNVVLEFERGEDGDVTGWHIGEHREFRFTPAMDLPTVHEVASRVARTHRLDLLESIGPLHMKSTLRMEKVGITGEVNVVLEWPNRFRVDTRARDQFENIAFDGETVWYASTATPLAPMEEELAVAVRTGNSFALMGDWNAFFPTMEVIQTLQDGAREIVVVRLGDTSAPATTLYVDWATGRLVLKDSVSVVPGMGRVGQHVRFGEFRDVNGMLLPFKSSVTLANSLIGTVETTVDEYELGEGIAEGTFELTD